MKVKANEFRKRIDFYKIKWDINVGSNKSVLFFRFTVVSGDGVFNKLNDSFSQVSIKTIF